MDMLAAIQAGRYSEADDIRRQFLPLEDFAQPDSTDSCLAPRCRFGQALQKTGPLLPMLGELASNDEAAVAIAAGNWPKWNQSKPA